MNEKLKSFLLNDQIFYGCVVILVALGSFGLGRASLGEETQKPLENGQFASLEAASAMPIQARAESVPVPAATASSQGTLVASKSGTKYHLLTCPGAKQIKEENKVFFASVAEAEAAGYKPAANCPQLP